MARRSCATATSTASRQRSHPVAPVGRADAGPAVAMLRRAGFGGQVGRLLRWPLQSPHGVVLETARRVRGEPAGAACCASFGATGWIGALGVAPEARGRGIGTALTSACVAWLRDRGAATVLLYATEAGRPLYEQEGFVAEGHAVAWQGKLGAGPPGVRSLREGDRDAVAALDAQTTGEDRAPVLGALSPLHGVAAERDGTVAGWALATPWGSSVAVCAQEPEDGLALMAATCAAPGGGTLIVPEDNAPAAEAVRRWGLARANGAERMRLGPAVPWRPDRQFGLFNLFWG